MRTKVRISVIWMAALFVLVGSAFSFAAVGSKHEQKAPKVEQADEQENETPEVEATETDSPSPEATPGERKQNHGFFVSAAAHCEDVDDPATELNPDFTAPEDCKDNGKAHGEYVSSVAKSSAGKKDHGSEDGS
jgi:hypothetical protein